MFQLIIDPEKCNKDGICVYECPARIIAMPTKGSVPEQTQNFDERCLRCGHCVAVCPAGALSLNWLAPKDCPSVNKEAHLEALQAEQFLRARRSYRTYKDKIVEREKLEKLLEIAGYAPSARNNQPWRWTVVGTPSETKRLAGMVVECMRLLIRKDPQTAIQRGLTRVVEKWDKGDDRVCNGAPCVIVAHGDKDYCFGSEDCALALCYLDLFAPSLGLGACWAGHLYSVVNEYRPLQEALRLPPTDKAFGALMIGYPKFKYHRLPLRNAPRVTWL